MKPINSQKNNKSPGKNVLIEEFYRHFSNELASDLLDVYNSWEKLGTMGVISRIGIISVMYEKSAKKDIEYYRPIYYNY